MESELGLKGRISAERYQRAMSRAGGAGFPRCNMCLSHMQLVIGLCISTGLSLKALRSFAGHPPAEIHGSKEQHKGLEKAVIEVRTSRRKKNH